MKLLIDECLSPELSLIAWDAGFVCAHVTRLGLQGAEDWHLTGYAINDDRILVTNNTADFITLVGREELHPGLVCLNIAPEHMNLETQKRLFQRALNHLLNQDPVNEVLEITLDARGRVRAQRYRWPS